MPVLNPHREAASLSSLLPHQQRVVAEAADLRQRLEALLTFLGTPMFASVSSEEQALLLEQGGWMRRYLTTLEARIALWIGKA